ncbi:restriction endonuclease subunit S [Gemmatimonadota bacterium]
MKEGWETATLGDTCEMYQPKTISGKEMVEDGKYPVFGANGIIGRYDKYNHEEPQLLITCRGATCGSVNISEPKSWVTGNAMVIRPKNEIIGLRFLEYLFRGGIDISKAITGAAQPQITRTNLIPLEIRYPVSVKEQKRIVAILDEVFAEIETAAANAEKNLANARELFESYLNAVFTQKDGSPIVLIGEVAQVFDGPHATPKTVEAGPIFLNISALQDGKINLGKTRHVTPEDFKKWTRRVVPKADDIVFSYETRIGQAAIIPSDLECCLGRRMGLVHVNKSRLNPRFFVYQYISPPFRRFLDSRTLRGATVDRISIKEFPEFPFKLPRLEEQENMVDHLDTLREKILRLESINQRKLAALTELKQSILQKAFTGELTAQPAGQEVLA